MLKFLLFFFMLCHYANASVYHAPFTIIKNALLDASNLDKRHLGRVFSRVITHNYEVFEQTSPFNHNKHMHHNGSILWPTSDTLIRTTHIHANNSQLLDFHQELSKRYNPHQFNKGIIKPPIILPKGSSGPDIGNYNATASYIPGHMHCFVNGHQRSFYAHKLTFPLLVTTFFDAAAAADITEYPKGKPHNWYAPIEQVLLMSSKNQYINEFAILDGDKQEGFWGNYSQFAIALIPEGTTIYGHFGLTAFQINRKCGTFKQGGTSQFYIAAATNDTKDIELINIDALKANGDINFVDSLVGLGLINHSERLVFDELRRGFKSYYDIYEIKERKKI